MRKPLPANPGSPQRYNHEYERRVTCNLLMVFEPKACLRYIDVSKRRTALDFAQQMKALVDEHTPEAERKWLVLDNLNTHRGRTLRSVLAGRGQMHLPSPGVSIGAQARVLAKPSGDRVLDALSGVGWRKEDSGYGGAWGEKSRDGNEIATRRVRPRSGASRRRTLERSRGASTRRV